MDENGYARSLKMSESITELAGALIAAQAELPPVPKNKLNPFYKSKYAGLEDVMPVALKVLTKHGLGLVQTVGQDGNGGSSLTTMLVHTSGQWLSDTQPLLLKTADSQGQGSAITYARRYGAMPMLGMVAEEDDDGNAASTTAKPTPARKPAAQPSTARAAPYDGITPAQVKHLRATLTKVFGSDERARVEWMEAVFPKAVKGTMIHLGEISKKEASSLIDILMDDPPEVPERPSGGADGDPGPEEPE